MGLVAPQCILTKGLASARHGIVLCQVFVLTDCLGVMLHVCRSEKKKVCVCSCVCLGSLVVSVAIWFYLDAAATVSVLGTCRLVVVMPTSIFNDTYPIV